jgi:hypothetical protein
MAWRGDGTPHPHLSTTALTGSWVESPTRIYLLLPLPDGRDSKFVLFGANVFTYAVL